ncbi:putative mitochondrial transcription termination factor family protein isoform X2 [Iris pallida]|uniref:Mitochondrial transcription termination factor family protein isoform X2 n=1 Tax=Iris pallida TaxID=29817 RepID=A0AAX6I4K1_IRIPA|nr:putative mitochondrial transcription termination factor family protein isoform X2 [Iris pallida]
MNKLFFLNALRKNTTTISSSSPGLLWFSAAADKTQTSSPKPHFMVEYLINSCGVPPEKAARASVHLPKAKPPSDPDSVLRFLRRAGFADADVTRLLSKEPRILYADVERTLRPKLALLLEMGLSQAEAIELVCHSPASLRMSDLRLRIEFWKSLLGANDSLLKACRRDNFLLSSNLAERIVPNVSLLRERGYLDAQIAHVVIKIPRLVTRIPESFAAAVGWVEELGFPASSGMFCQALHLVACNTREGFDAKLRFLKGLGWSESDVMSAVKKHPKMFNLTEENLRSKMDFFLREVGFEISSLVHCPVLLDYSLERRLRPRYNVLRALKGDESQVARTRDFFMSENDFLERYAQKEKDPELYEAYVAACAGYQDTETKEAVKNEPGLIKKRRQMKQRGLVIQTKST